MVILLSVTVTATASLYHRVTASKRREAATRRKRPLKQDDVRPTRRQEQCTRVGRTEPGADFTVSRIEQCGHKGRLPLPVFVRGPMVIHACRAK
jgi:hypothetical protein